MNCRKINRIKIANKIHRKLIFVPATIKQFGEQKWNHRKIRFTKWTQKEAKYSEGVSVVTQIQHTFDLNYIWPQIRSQFSKS